MKFHKQPTFNLSLKNVQSLCTTCCSWQAVPEYRCSLGKSPVAIYHYPCSGHPKQDSGPVNVTRHLIGIVVWEVYQIAGRQTVQHLVCQNRYFVFYWSSNRKPMQPNTHWS